MFEPKPVADFRRAAFHLFLLAGLYATHSIYAFGVLSSKSKDPVGEFFGVLVCAAFLFLLLWAARVVGAAAGLSGPLC